MGYVCPVGHLPINKQGKRVNGVIVLVLAGILASTMSTADSQLLAASSSISEDIFKGVFRAV